MENIHQKIAGLGLKIPEIMLPRQDIDIRKWSVIACDQYTQDRNYWEKAKESAAGSPSSLNLIFPEIYLPDGDRERRIADIHRSMKTYLRDGVFDPPRQGWVYLERNTPFNRCRRGLVLAVDLERYDWAPSARPLIRSTEGTVPERLPPRMDIRRDAPLELPHILLLIDDDNDALLGGLAGRAKKKKPIYQSSLMMDSGDISGWFLEEEDDFAFAASCLEALALRAPGRYKQAQGETPFLFAMGDGNHSLAAAKGIWEEYKKTHSRNGALPEHPCRYALVEVENIYDPAIKFEPIHRVLFNTSIDGILNLLSALPGFSSRPAADRTELARLVGDPAAEKNRLGIVAGTRCVLAESSAPGLAAVSLQPLLDRFIGGAGGGGAVGGATGEGADTAGGATGEGTDTVGSATGEGTDTVGSATATAGGATGGGAAGSEIDYIHGEEELFRLACGGERPAVGILLPPVKKAGLFETVARSGPLPRKSFSMGEACEKRFYLECRKLFEGET
jgi:hypothetical protein